MFRTVLQRKAYHSANSKYNIQHHIFRYAAVVANFATADFFVKCAVFLNASHLKQKHFYGKILIDKLVKVGMIWNIW